MYLLSYVSSKLCTWLWNLEVGVLYGFKSLLRGNELFNKQKTMQAKKSMKVYVYFNDYKVCFEHT